MNTRKRPSGWRPARNDVLLAAAVAVFVLVPTVYLDRFHEPPFERALDPLGIALLVLGTVPLAWRTTAPVLVGALVLPSTAAYYPLGYPDGPVIIAGAVALYSMVVLGRRRQGWVLGLAQWGVIHGWDAVAYGAPRGQSVGVLAWVLVVLVSAELTRRRREYTAAQEARIAEAARAREEEVLRRASEERLRIAREVHDTVAHSVSLINVQAGTALYLIDSEPDRAAERAAEALATIKRTSRETLQELRATLNVLRSVDERAPRAPGPGLDRIEELAAGTRGAGIEVGVAVAGNRRRLGAGVEAAGYRIVQESLTNTVRHSGAAHASVRLDYGDDTLGITVSDDGRGAPACASEGNGLRGMGERAAALGGEFSAGTDAHGTGFTVSALLPVGGDDAPAITGDSDAERPERVPGPPTPGGDA